MGFYNGDRLLVAFVGLHDREKKTTSNKPNYVLESCESTMPAAERGSVLSITHGSPNAVPVSELDQEVLKGLMEQKWR